MIAPTAPGPVVFGLLGGGLAWGLHLGLLYSAQEIACDTSLAGERALGLNGYEWLLAALTGALALVALAAGATAFRGWRETGGRAPRRPAPVRRTRALAVAGMLLDAIFLAAILMGGIAAFFLDQCGPG